jgi:hypothetical protein
MVMVMSMTMIPEIALPARRARRVVPVVISVEVVVGAARDVARLVGVQARCHSCSCRAAVAVGSAVPFPHAFFDLSR